MKNEETKSDTDKDTDSDTDKHRNNIRELMSMPIERQEALRRLYRVRRFKQLCWQFGGFILAFLALLFFWIDWNKACMAHVLIALIFFYLAADMKIR